MASTSPGEPQPLPAPLADPELPRSVVDFALQRRAALEQLARGGWLRGDSEDPRDADPYLLRAAKFHGEPTGRRCPVCRREDVLTLTYVFGEQLGPYSGRIRSTAELAAMAHEYGEFKVYVVEVGRDCGWNHLLMTYLLGDGVPRTPPRRPRDLLD